MARYRCTVCGYVYDEATGDTDGGVDGGTLWADVPDDWVCPVCAMPKSAFEPVED